MIKQPLAYSLAVTFVGMIAALGLAIGYTAHTASDNEQKWCDLVITLDKQYRASPPSTDNGRVLAEIIARLKADLDC